MEWDGSLFLSVSLSPPGCSPCPTAKEKKPAGDGGPSCELTLGMASYRCNVPRRSPSPPQPPAELAESSHDSTLSLELSLSPPSGKQRRAKPSHLEKEAESRKSKAREAEGDDPQPSNPRRTWREKVKSMMGTDVTRVVMKRAFPTDISRSHARFLLTDGKEDKEMARERGARGPTKLLGLLTEAEKAAAHGPQGLPVMLLDRWGVEYQEDKIKYWKSSDSYNIVGKWNDFVELNELDPGDVVEVHLFRVPPDMEPAPPAPTATSMEAVGGGGREGWRVGMAVCSLVPEEEMERRRRDTPEARKSRRREIEEAMKRKRTAKGGKERVRGN